MNSSGSELSWPTTASHETSFFCCFPIRKAPKVPKTVQQVKPSANVYKPPPTKPVDKSKFVMLFNPKVPMTPNLARSDSNYIIEGFFFESIQKRAYVTVQEGQAYVPCSAELNDGFVPSGKRKRLMYVGFRYPDGTSLSYVPIRDVILQHRCNAMSQTLSFEKGGRKLSAIYGKDYVYLSIPRAIYCALVQMAEEVFNKRDRNSTFLRPEAEIRGERVWLFNTEMKESSKVEGSIKGRRYAKTVHQAMKESGGNLEGDALLYVRFCEDLQSGDPVMKLQLRLHRMFVKEVTRY